MRRRAWGPIGWTLAFSVFVVAWVTYVVVGLTAAR